MENKTNKKGLFIGLLGLLGIIVVVSLVGYITSKPNTLVLQGEAEATEYRVSGKIAGRINKFLVEEGAQVQKGDTLVIIDSPELLAKVEQAEAAKQAAEAQNLKAIKGARAEQITSAYEIWQKAEAGAEIAKKSFDRVQKLYEKEVVSLQKRDEAEAQYKAAEATAKAAKAQYEMAYNGAEKEDKLAASALVSRAKGAINEVTSYLSETFLTSPISGEISEIFPKHGELVGTGAPIMTVIDLDDMWFSFNVREDLLSGIKMNGEIEVKIPALGEEKYKLKVIHIKSLASYATWRATKVSGQFDIKTFEVRAKPVAPIKNLRPGMSAIIEKNL